MNIPKNILSQGAATCYAYTDHWANIAQKHGKTDIAEKLFLKRNFIGKLIYSYVPHPMRPNNSVIGHGGSKFRRKWLSLPAETREKIIQKYSLSQLWCYWMLVA